MKIITKIFGGLGNQMFQYACGRAVARRLGVKFCLDLSWFESGNRIFMLDAFPNLEYNLWIRKKSKFTVIALPCKLLNQMGLFSIKNVQEPDYSYWSGIENIRSAVRLSGYWQNEQYFLKIRDIIKHDFFFPSFSCDETRSFAQEIIPFPNPVCIHVRRGDYVENAKINQYHGICSAEYYEKAIQLIVKKFEYKVKLYVFTDDPVWVAKNFNAHGCPFVVIDIPQHKNEPWHDMHLMSLCKHHIIANSSFSWWGAWLSDSGGLTIAPKQWFAEETMKNCNPASSSWTIV